MMNSIYILVIVYYKVNAAIHLENVECAPHIDYIPVDSEYHRYFPYIVKLFRCQGSSMFISPRFRKCLPKNVTSENILVFENNVVTSVVLQNHSSCVTGCTMNATLCNRYETWNSQQCRCDCLYSSHKPKPCCVPKIWSSTFCDCVCPIDPKVCSKQMEWSEELCSCVCKQSYFLNCSKKNHSLNLDTCVCTAPVTGTILPRDCSKSGVSITYGIVLLVMFIEALVIVLGYIICYLCCLKNIIAERNKCRENVALLNKQSSPKIKCGL